MKDRRGLAIRLASPADVAELARLVAACGHAIAPGLLTDRLSAYQSGSGTVLAAWEWGPPSGLVAMHWHASLREDRPVARLDVLLVAPDDRRRGVGRILVKAAAQAARIAGCGTLVLDVASVEPELAGFCEASGFTRAGVTFVRPLRKAQSDVPPSDLA